MKISNLINNPFLNSLDEFDLRVKILVKNIYEGINRSKRSGFAQDFTQYRNYQNGDDPKFIDWNLYARSDRYFVKESETNSRKIFRIIIDASKSMAFEFSNLSKIDFSKFIAASIGQIAKNQHDLLKLDIIKDGKIFSKKYNPNKFFHQFLYDIQKLSCSGLFLDSDKMKIEQLDLRKNEEFILLISDFYQTTNEQYEFLDILKNSDNDLNVFHILTEAELILSTEINILEDLETGIQYHSSQNKQYLDKLNQYIHSFRIYCTKHNIQYQSIQNETDLITSLISFFKSKAIYD